MTHVLIISSVAVLSCLVMVMADTDAPPSEVERYLEKYKKQLGDSIKETLKQRQQKKNGGSVNTNENDSPATDDSRAISAGYVRHERSLSKKTASEKLKVVSFHKLGAGRVKRATYNTTANTWPLDIPYKFDTSFPTELIPVVKMVMQTIMENVCVTFHEEPNFDPENNNYETNAYILFEGTPGSVCSAMFGQGANKKGPRSIQTCTSWDSITHEIFHSLGVIHDQQGPDSLNHVTRVKDNVESGYYSNNYQPKNFPEIIFTSEFDASSVMMYSVRQFSKNGLNVLLPIRKDEVNLNDGRRNNVANVFEELNQVYKCREKFCGNTVVECGIGYYTKIGTTCKCVCPEGFDPRNNCAKLIDETSGPTEWPKASFSLFAGEAKDDCPPGFKPGTVGVSGTRSAINQLGSFFISGSTVNFHMCTRDVPEGTSMDELPMGPYCVVKPKGIPCGKPFVEGGFNVTSIQEVIYEGNYGDWEISADNKVIMKYCCRGDSNHNDEIDTIPITKPFRILPKNSGCPAIKGLRSRLDRVVLFVQSTTEYGDFPYRWKRSYYLMNAICTYKPPVYGCSEQVYLNSANRNVIIKTPGFDDGQREANRRCLYYISVPEHARIKVTMNTFDIDSLDKFHLRRFNKWSKPQTDFFYHQRKEFFSDKNFLFIDYWSGFQSDSGKKGIELHAEVLLEQESCFDTSTHGRDYMGTKSITEAFEECAPWKDAVNSLDFPFTSIGALDLLSHNFCRNPDGSMERPWCYVLSDMGLYRKAYCDVCNRLDDIDHVDDCENLKASDADFCTKALQKSKCSKTCELKVNVPVPPEVCGPLKIPDDGELLGFVEQEYSVGQTVSIKCNNRDYSAPPLDIMCTSAGWPDLKSACSECPANWIPFKDRCFYYDPLPLFISEASDYCYYLGGRLFVLRSGYDVMVIRTFKHVTDIHLSKGSSWVDAKLRDDGTWGRFEDPSVDLPFADWIPNAILDDGINHDCAVMVYENDTVNAGKFQPTSCYDSLSRTFCEMPRTPPEDCSDVTSKCSVAVNYDAGFCSRDNSFSIASEYCRKTCGTCSDGYGDVCYEPSGENYKRISDSSSIEVGKFMEFACDEGYFQTAGDLRRMCGVGGVLLGKKPVCTSTPFTMDIGMDIVQDRFSEVQTNKAYLFDVDGYRIPFEGIITHWHFDGVKAGVLQAMVYRKNADTQLFELVGYNDITVSTINEKWTVAVPQTDQLRVRKGDVYALYTTGGVLAATPCDGKEEKLMELRTYKSKNLATLISQDRSFAFKTCIFPSLSFRIQPYSNGDQDRGLGDGTSDHQRRVSVIQVDTPSGKGI